MKTLAELNKDLADSLTKQQDILDAADKDTGGKLSVAQKLEFDATEKVYNEAFAAKEELAADAKRRAAIDKRRKDNEDLDSLLLKPRQSDPPDVRTKITDQREAFELDPKKGFKTPREYLKCVIDTGENAVSDNRLKYLAVDSKGNRLLTVGSDEARVISDPAGGFLVPEGFSPNLLMIPAEADPLAGKTSLIPMASPTVKFPARVDKDHTTSVSGGFTVSRKPETVAATPSQDTFERVVLEVHDLLGAAYATENIMTDSPISFAAIIELGFREQFGAQMIKERLNGTGIGEFTGVINAPCTISIAKETGQPARTILKENIDKMRARCWGYGQAIWLANQDTYIQLVNLVQLIGTGGTAVPYLVTDVNGNSSLNGRPLFFTEYCKTRGTVGDLVLGNWSQYLEGNYQPLQSAESIHVRFLNRERTFLFWTRNAGGPWWKSALTPQNSTDTLSPFITLATRA